MTSVFKLEVLCPFVIGGILLRQLEWKLWDDVHERLPPGERFSGTHWEVPRLLRVHRKLYPDSKLWIGYLVLLFLWLPLFGSVLNTFLQIARARVGW